MSTLKGSLFMFKKRHQGGWPACILNWSQKAIAVACIETLGTFHSEGLSYCVIFPAWPFCDSSNQSWTICKKNLKLHVQCILSSSLTEDNSIILLEYCVKEKQGSTKIMCPDHFSANKRKIQRQLRVIFQPILKQFIWQFQPIKTDLKL